MNYLGIIAALLVAGNYLFFLREMDIFEKEKTRYTIFCFLLGAIATFMIIPIQLYGHVLTWFPSDGNFLQRLRFHLLSVAAFEEIIKLVPFLVFWRFTKVIDESFDFIKYASVGALGFATIENMLYFQQSLYSIESRAFYTAILHMFTTSCIAYLIYWGKHWKKQYTNWLIIPGYVFAVFFHGLYNATISVYDTHWVGVGLIAVSLVVWGRMMNNLLNNSHFYQEHAIQNKTVVAGVKLLIGWALIFLFAAFSIGYTDGVQAAIHFMSEGFLFGFVTGLGLYFALARPRIQQGQWFPLLSKKKHIH